MKTLGFFLVVLTITKAQIIFPNEEAAPKPIDTELFEVLEVDDRQAFSSCVTPNGESGRCQSFSSCGAYASLRRSLHRPSVLNFLRGRICRRLRHTVHLCCPASNIQLPVTGPSQPSSSSSLPTQCGSTPLVNRVVGGVTTEPGEWPWLAALGNLDGNTFTSGCAGSLITRRHVLTAGHCFEPGQPHPTMVRLGAYSLTRSSTTVAPQDFTIKDRRDGGYNTNTKENDITIVILDRDAEFNDYVQPACLPFRYRNRDFLGDDLVVTGWGKTRFGNFRTSDVPMKAVVPVTDTNRCAVSYRALPANKRPVIDNRSLCAGSGTTDACGGDSGGPLHYLDLSDGKYYVVGVVSFGVGCARSDFPGVYTRVTSFLDWIERNV
ncbi:hypothetical protein O3P69_007391 [Scylla paramamosain]